MSKLPFVITISWLLMAAMVFTPSVTDAESFRREDYVKRGMLVLEKGDEAVKVRDYEKATAYYKQACDLLPNLGPGAMIENAVAIKAAYTRALDGFCKASCSLAEQRMAEDRQGEAENLLRVVIDERYNPRCKEAMKLLAQLEDPVINSPTVTPEIRAKIEKIKKLLTEAQGYYDTERYDFAIKRCEEALSMYLYNQAARVLKGKARKGKEGRAETPAKAVTRSVNAAVEPAVGLLALEKGDRALKARDYEKAAASYKQACDTIPQTEDTKVAHQRSLDSFCKASCLFAEQRIAEGRYADAQNVLRVVLDERYNPRYKDAIKMLAQLEDSEWHDKSEAQISANAEKIKPLMIEARDYYETGRYNLAIKRCEQILAIDPDNEEARTLQESCERAGEAQQKLRGRAEKP